MSCGDCGKGPRPVGLGRIGFREWVQCAVVHGEHVVAFVVHTIERPRRRRRLRRCAFRGCGRAEYRRGLCSGHYSQERRGLGLRALRGEHGCVLDGCRVRGCCGAHYARGLCRSHYDRRLERRRPPRRRR